ncbi:hypothetical protein ATANTOWER_022616 [Ataeniobius toweri]|uniref:Secreted protein n=1 Tax=Ataeniobius toweri TaxID=208326 RepID=A0ABU7C1Q3_9TELE|nr:hypothetical protein [Ataeniobius toweri]
MSSFSLFIILMLLQSYLSLPCLHGITYSSSRCLRGSSHHLFCLEYSFINAPKCLHAITHSSSLPSQTHSASVPLRHNLSFSCLFSLSNELTPPSYFPVSEGVAQSSSPSNGSRLP